MTKQEFQSKYGDSCTENTTDVLMCVLSQLTVFQLEHLNRGTGAHIRISEIKEFIADYRSVLKIQQQCKCFNG